MPKYQGTYEERMRFLDRTGRRCDGNERHCTQAAVTRLQLQPLADGKPAGEPLTVQVCSSARHRAPYIDNRDYQVLSTLDIHAYNRRHHRARRLREEQQ